MEDDIDDIHDRVHDTIIAWMEKALDSRKSRRHSMRRVCQDVKVAISCASLLMWRSVSSKSEPESSSDEAFLEIITLAMQTGAAMESQWQAGDLGFDAEQYPDR